jgi:hypothetical protein
MIFSKTNRGNDLLIHEDKMYIFDKNLKNDSKRWRCKDRLCKGAITLDSSNNELHSSDPPPSIDSSHVKVHLAKERLRKRLILEMKVLLEFLQSRHQD